jgi:hypothetical protein
MQRNPEGPGVLAGRFNVLRRSDLLRPNFYAQQSAVARRPKVFQRHGSRILGGGKRDLKGLLAVDNHIELSTFDLVPDEGVHAKIQRQRLVCGCIDHNLNLVGGTHAPRAPAFGR